MIKALYKKGDKVSGIVLGLSGENVTRLAAGEPIVFNLSELGLTPIEVIITYGKTEDDIRQDLGRLMGS